MKIEGTDIEVTEATLYRPQAGDILMFTVNVNSQEVLGRITDLLQSRMPTGVKVLTFSPQITFDGVVRNVTKVPPTPPG